MGGGRKRGEIFTGSDIHRGAKSQSRNLSGRRPAPAPPSSSFDNWFAFREEKLSLLYMASAVGVTRLRQMRIDTGPPARLRTTHRPQSIRRVPAASEAAPAGGGGVEASDARRIPKPIVDLGAGRQPATHNHAQAQFRLATFFDELFMYRLTIQPQCRPAFLP